MPWYFLKLSRANVPYMYSHFQDLFVHILDIYIFGLILILKYLVYILDLRLLLNFSLDNRFVIYLQSIGNNNQTLSFETKYYGDNVFPLIISKFCFELFP